MYVPGHEPLLYQEYEGLVKTPCQNPRNLRIPQRNDAYAADVDGTLIESVGSRSNGLHKAAFSAAMKEVFGLDTDIDVRSPTVVVAPEM